MNFFWDHWLFIFWAAIGAAFLVLGVVALVDKTRLKLRQHRYRVARRERWGMQK